MGRSDFRDRELSPASRGKNLGDGRNAVEPMRCPPEILVVRTRRQNPQLAINLHAIRVDDYPVKRPRNIECERGFSAGRRAADDQDRFLRVVRHQL